MEGKQRRWLAGFGVALVALTGTASASAEPLEQVALDYALQCQGCHLADGRGGGDIPSLHGVGRFAGIAGGREYLARVPGVSNASIDDARLGRLLSWVLERWSADVLPADFLPYQPEEIAAWRTPLADPSATRAGLIAGR